MWIGVVGCQQWAMTPTINESSLQEQAIGYLKQAIASPQSATVRCQAVEALAEESPRGAENWFIEALGDESPAVRFAACVALGRTRYRPAMDTLRQRLGDENHSVRASALFALHRMGDTNRSGELAEMLLHHKDKEVRGNTAMLFGLLGEAKAIPLLKRAQKDADYMVAWQALESQMLLGDSQAFGRVATQVNSGREDIRVLAMLALGRRGDPKAAEVIRQHLNKTTNHVETRLAAARALGMIGFEDGLELARRSLKFNTPDPDARAGKAEDQIMRVQTMAALALGAIRARVALPDLERLMVDSLDPRVQVAAARAIVETLSTKRATVIPAAQPLPEQKPSS